MKLFLALGALFMAAAVVSGAFGAHGLKGKLSPELMVAFKTAVDYQIYHALALLALGLTVGVYNESTLLSVAGAFFILGIVLFSGSLYGLALTGMKWLGPVTPIGGLSFIIGWVLMFIGVVRA